MRVAPEVKLSDEQRQELEKLARGRTVTVRAAQRAKMILMAASGLTDSAIGEALGVSRQNFEIYIAQHNTNPKPFVWTAKASHILEKVKTRSCLRQ